MRGGKDKQKTINRALREQKKCEKSSRRNRIDKVHKKETDWKQGGATNSGEPYNER
jgi:hypothetical protein